LAGKQVVAQFHELAAKVIALRIAAKGKNPVLRGNADLAVPAGMRIDVVLWQACSRSTESSSR
jgi:hypothetical protein